MIIKKVRRWIGAALAAVLLAGCSSQPEIVYKEERLPQNDGESATVTMDVSLLGPEEEAYLPFIREVIERYRADFPNTQIELVEDPEADIVTVTGSLQGAGGLLDLAEYKDFWYGQGTMTPGANFCMAFMGGEAIYAIPADMQQMVLYYRSDWFDKFNANKETAAEKVRLLTWNRFLEVRSKLSDQGRLAISRELCEPLFNAMMWSIVGTGASSAGPCFSKREEGATAFTAEKAPKAVETFGMVMDSALRDGNMSPEEAVDAFIAGEAGMLIASGTAAARLYEEMEAGRWESTVLPMGDIGQSVVPLLSWWGWGVNENAADIEKSVHFLCYLTNADNNTHMAKVCGSLPIYKESTSMELTLNESDRAPELAIFTAADFRFAGMPYYMFPGFGQDWNGSPSDGSSVFTYTPSLYRQELEDHLDGKLSSEELLERLDTLCRGVYQDWLDSGKEIPWIIPEETPNPQT